MGGCIGQTRVAGQALANPMGTPSGVVRGIADEVESDRRTCSDSCLKVVASSWVASTRSHWERQKVATGGRTVLRAVADVVMLLERCWSVAYPSKVPLGSP